jgi:hypothetical protein
MGIIKVRNALQMSTVYPQNVRIIGGSGTVHVGAQTVP